ncbi:MAG: peptide-methionine (S)-S-oxide reductase, partial [Rhizobiales bacterium]|nr:peptide-methionine (S)-S-oxide reductase [Hyphomicrobiales bacterium]
MFKRIGGAIALVILVTALFGIGTGQYRSWLRDLDYSQAVHEDESTLSSGAERAIGPDEIELFVRTERDEIRRLIADREELSAFVEGQLARLKQNRAIAKDVASKDAELVMRLSFADADARVATYADWFYEWKRSYVLLKETVLSAAHRTVASGSETWREAVERDVTDYFMRHFTDQVLQPERREPLVEAGVRNTLEHAHSNFLNAVADYDLHLRLFLEEHTEIFDTEALGDKVEVELDWDAQRWKAPFYAAEDYHQNYYQG